MSYTVRLDLFEGPLDLLLYLIRKEEIEITEISVARITDQYLSHLETLQALELDSAGEYVLMAATLVRIKSRMLLPRQNEFDEEDDPQRDLVHQLQEYRKYKEVAGRLSDLSQERSQLHDFQPSVPIDALRSKEEIFSVAFPELLGALRDVMGTVAQREIKHRVELENITIEEKMDFLRGRLRQRSRFIFRDIFAEAESRQHIVVSFMALLELMKAGEVSVYQEGAFAEVWIEMTVPHDDEEELAQAVGA
ncbi:MAG: segregation/condensation protein A [bacterium]|nr:segregation/condensation protein A [bacterium]